MGGLILPPTGAIFTDPTDDPGLARGAGFYLPALAAPNDLTRFRRTGHRRDLNRPQFAAQALERRLADPDADASAVLPVLRRALAERAVHPAASRCHPKVLSADRLDRVILQRSRGGDAGGCSGMTARA